MTKKTYLLLASFFFSFFYVYTIGWSDFHTFPDINNYIYRIEYLANGGEESVHRGISYFFSEPVWKYLLQSIANIFNQDSYLNGFYLTAFFSLFIYAYFTFQRIHPILAIIFFLNPMFIDLIMGQTRIALSFSLLLLAFQYKNKVLLFSILLVVCATLIHTTALLFVGIYVLLIFLYSKFNERSYYTTAFLLSIAIPVFLRYIAPIILSAVGDRRFNVTAYGSSSLTYALIWLIISLILVTFSNNYIKSKNQSIIIGYAIVMTGLFFFSSLMGLYGQRFVALSIPLIIISINYLPKYYREMTFIALGLYLEIQWIYWLEISLK